VDSLSVRAELADLFRSYVGDVGGQVYQPATTLPIKGIAFCGVAYLHVCREYGLTDLIWGPGFMLSAHLPTTTDPQLGDLQYVHKPYNHHEMFIARDGNAVHVISANSLDKTGAQWKARSTIERVRTIEEMGGASNVTHYSIQPWVDEFLAGGRYRSSPPAVTTPAASWDDVRREMESRGIDPDALIQAARDQDWCAKEDGDDECNG